jgi:hypothetical protein
MKSAKLIPFQSPPADDDVGAALNLLRDALAEEAQRINEEGAKAMKSGHRHYLDDPVITTVKALRAAGWIKDDLDNSGGPQKISP